MFIGGGVAALLLLILMNLSGERNTATKVKEEEVRLLRERVEQLETRLGATLINSGRGTATTAATLQSSSGVIVQRPGQGAVRVVDPVPPVAAASAAPAQASAVAAAVAPIESRSSVAVMAAPVAGGGAGGALVERKRPATPKGTVGMGSYWSDKDVQFPGGEWCREPPPYAALKPLLPNVPEGTDRPLLTTELAKKHASSDNMLIATYVNYNRLDFAYTFVKHLIALKNPHFLVGALDEKALRGLQSHGIPTFLIDSGLTTNDYGWGTYAFRQVATAPCSLLPTASLLPAACCLG